MSNEKKYPINGFAPGHYWCVCGNCKERFFGDKRSVRCEPCALKYIEPVKENTLPPELVEKFKDAFKFNKFGEYTSVQNECAQIAVDYADEQNAYIVHTFTESLNEIQKQRNELIECLKMVQLTPSFDESKEEFGHLKTHWTHTVEQLLKKHES